jgi:hypothetical protein
MANPKIMSYSSRGVKIENITEGVPINIFVKDGIPLAIKIDQDTTYIKYKIKVEFLKKDEKIVKEDVLKNKQLFALFNSMKQYMFSSDTIVYCFYKNRKIYVYDCMSNTNYFPFCDIEKIAYNKKYSYGKTKGNEVGFIPMKPILSGYKSSKEVLEFIDKYLKEHEELKITDLFIMPAFPEFSSSTYKFLDEQHKNDLTPEEQDFDIEEIIKSLDSELVLEEEKKEKFVPLIKLSSELDKETKYTISFIKSYIASNKISLNDIENTLISPTAELWTVWSNVEMMGIVYKKLINVFSNVVQAGVNLRKYPFEVLSKVFYDIFITEEKDFISKLSPTQKSAFTEKFLTKVLADEYTYFLNAFYSNYGKHFVPHWQLGDIPNISK